MLAKCTGFFVLLGGATGLRKEVEAESTQIGAHSAANAAASRGFAVDTMKALEGQKITPKVAEILGAVKAELAGSVTDAIKQDHLSAQQEIDRLVSELSASTTAAVKANTLAKGAHAAWSACVAQEQDFLKKHEDLLALAATQDTDQQNKYAAAVKLAPFSAKTPKMGLVCDISAKGNCDAEIQKLQQTAKTQIAQVNNEAATARAAYKAALAAFHAANKTHANTVREAEAMQGTYQAKRVSCASLKGKSTQQVCNFGASYKAKCTDQVDWSKRKTAIGTSPGDEWSDPDRRTEWASTQSTICMITAFLKDHSLSTAEVSSCQASINYDKDVGKINFKEAAVDALMTAPKFTCKETEISYDDDWVVPTSEAPTSAQYQKKSSKVIKLSLEGDKTIADCA